MMTEWDEIKDEKGLLLKLFETDHLNVPERKSLPKGMVRKSVVRELILDHLRMYGWFPGEKQKPINDSGGQYFQIEYDGNDRCILHHNYEHSYLKYKHKIVKHKSVDSLIISYLKEKEKEGLDGLTIDWQS